MTLNPKLSTVNPRRPSIITDCQIGVDVDYVLSNIAQHGLGTNEVAWSIDMMSPDDPYYRSSIHLWRQLLNPPAALVKHIKTRAKHYGIPPSYVHQANVTVIYIAKLGGRG